MPLKKIGLYSLALLFVANLSWTCWQIAKRAVDHFRQQGYSNAIQQVVQQLQFSGEITFSVIGKDGKPVQIKAVIEK